MLETDSDSASIQETGSHGVFHADGTQSNVYRQLEELGDGNSRWVAVKIVSFLANESTKPHDVLKEAKLLLEETQHSNIISPYKFTVDRYKQQYELTMPLLPLSLSGLLESPYLLPEQPCVPPAAMSAPSPILLIPHRQQECFSVLCKSIAFQIVTAVAYLHGLSPPIAHRDIKPSNVLIDEVGCVKLIDFGIAWQHSTSLSTPANGEVSPYDVPEETPASMICQVGSGSYRAIELLFSPPIYDARATDLWSLGVTLCMFFTELQWVRESMYDDESGGVEDDDVIESRMRWSRKTLFNGSRGEIALIWSIFQLLGTPNKTSWPNFYDLPGAQMMNFTVTPPMDLRERLVNLPHQNASPTQTAADPVDLIQRFLVLNPRNRLDALSAAKHPWFWTGDPLILPRGHPGPPLENSEPPSRWEHTWRGYNLGDLVYPGVQAAYSTWRTSL